jgi:hypothetical protein
MPFLHFEAHGFVWTYRFTTFIWILLKFCNVVSCDDEARVLSLDKVYNA